MCMTHPVSWKDAKGATEVENIIGISGSPRAGGNTDILLQQFLRGANKAGARTERVFLRDYLIQPCTGCEQCRKSKVCTRFQDGMQLLYPKLIESKGIVLGSPTYNYNVTPQVKAFIDRLYIFYDFTDERPRNYSSRLAHQGRKGIVFSICEQPDISEMGVTLEAMSKPFEVLGYEITCRFPVTGIFDKGAVSAKPELMESAFQKGFDLGKSLNNR